MARRPEGLSNPALSAKETGMIKEKNKPHTVDRGIITYDKKIPEPIDSGNENIGHSGAADLFAADENLPNTSELQDKVSQLKEKLNARIRKETISDLKPNKDGTDYSNRGLTETLKLEPEETIIKNSKDIHKDVMKTYKDKIIDIAVDNSKEFGEKQALIETYLKALKESTRQNLTMNELDSYRLEYLHNKDIKKPELKRYQDAIYEIMTDDSREIESKKRSIDFNLDLFTEAVKHERARELISKKDKKDAYEKSSVDKMFDDKIKGDEMLGKAA